MFWLFGIAIFRKNLAKLNSRTTALLLGDSFQNPYELYRMVFFLLSFDENIDTHSNLLIEAILESIHMIGFS